MKSIERRTGQRILYKSSVSYMALGNPIHPPFKDACAEIMDLSDDGMRLRIEGGRLDENAMLLVKVPLMSSSVTVPSLVQVKWIKEEEPEAYQVGLKNMLSFRLSNEILCRLLDLRLDRSEG